MSVKINAICSVKICQANLQLSVATFIYFFMSGCTLMGSNTLLQIEECSDRLGAFIQVVCFKPCDMQYRLCSESLQFAIHTK